MRLQRRAALPLALLLVLPTLACGTGEAPPKPGVVEVTARDFAFDAPDSIPSGWITFEMENVGAQEHFMNLWPLPEGRSYREYLDEVIDPFERLGGMYYAGDIDRQELMEGLGRELPDWFPEFIAGAGGPGLVSPGGVARTTVKLEPGTYVMECYVKSPEGQPHNFLGMMRPIVVTEEASGASEPAADATVELANYRIDSSGTLEPGSRTVRVRMTEDPEGLLPHDVHLARLHEGTPVDSVVAWMDWVDRLQAPGPAEFLGGVEQMPAGSTGYVTVELAPGRYAWVSEAYGPRGVVSEFTVE
jgi:hypothetical protein